MINLYLFRGSILNFTNILQHCFMLSKEDLYDPCTPVIRNNLLDWDLAEFIKIGGEIPFRSIDWADHTEQLDFLIDNNLSRSYATYRLDQIDYLKNYFKDRCFVISFSYDVILYDFLLEIFVRTHIHRQNCGIVPITKYDQLLRESDINLVDYYTKEFDQQQLISKQLSGVGDYVVPLNDFFDQFKFFKHIENIGGTPSQQSINFYTNWLKSFEKIMQT